MKTCTVTLLLMVGMCSSGMAQPLRWYVGGGVRYGTVHALYTTTGRAMQSMLTAGKLGPEGIRYDGVGFQVEAGQMGRCATVYFGFGQDVAAYRSRFIHPVMSYELGSDDRQRWSGERILLGARLYPGSHDKAPMVPVVGAAVTVGWAQLRRELTEWNEVPGMSYRRTTSVHHSYDARIGWLLEAGLKADTRRLVDLWLLGRIEDLRMGEQPPPPSNSDVVFGYVHTHVQTSVSLGATYRFKR